MRFKARASPFFQFVSVILAYVLPAYQSYKAFLSQDPLAQAAWLKFWVIMAPLNLLDQIFDEYLQNVPFWYELKCLALIYFQWNGANRAQFVFSSVFTPVFSRIQPYVAKMINHITRIALESAKNTQQIRFNQNNEILF